MGPARFRCATLLHVWAGLACLCVPLSPMGKGKENLKSTLKRLTDSLNKYSSPRVGTLSAPYNLQILAPSIYLSYSLPLNGIESSRENRPSVDPSNGAKLWLGHLSRRRPHYGSGGI